MKIVTIIGARPQFIKASVVSRALSDKNQKDVHGKKVTEIIIHTGQHFDENMNDVFFQQLSLQKPHYNLGINNLSHGAMTGQMLEKIEKILLKEQPDMAMVYGDTNSTLAGALAASKLNISVAHVEAGLRSFNRKMPEELNRVVTDHLSSFLLCPTSVAVKNLKKEGITEGIYLCGDVMYDAFLRYQQVAENRSRILEHLNLKPGCYCLVTVHRVENTESAAQLEELFHLFSALAEDDLPFVIPLHPRTRSMIDNRVLRELSQQTRLRIIEPVGYIDMIMLETKAHNIFTDSGGVQKEAYFAKRPCITLRDETEWIETVENGWNQVVGVDKNKIINAFKSADVPNDKNNEFLFGKGNAGQLIVEKLLSHCKNL